MRVLLPDSIKAVHHLLRCDPALGELIRLIGPCTLRRDTDRFVVLVRSIISQQISTRAAAAIQKRLEQVLRPDRISAKSVLAFSVSDLRAAGLSTAKAGSIRDLADKVVSGALRLDLLHRLTDDQVIAKLIPLRGIGVWTAHMLLIFSLGRLDILPVTDWGLRVGIQRHYGLDKPPDKNRLDDIAECWRPFRSVATWYFWRSLGFVPQSNGRSEGLSS